NKIYSNHLHEALPISNSIKTDVKELEDAYILEAELPGMEKENINLQFEDNILTIEGKQSFENNKKDENGRIIHQERSFSDVKRQDRKSTRLNSSHVSI